MASLSERIAHAIIDLKYVTKPTVTLTPKGKRRKKRGISVLIGLILTTIFLLSLIGAVFQLLRLNVLPTYQIVIAGIILGLIWLYCLLGQFSRKRFRGKFLSFVCSVLLLTAFVFSSQTLSALNKISVESKGKEVTKKGDPFIIYLSGNDEEGKVTEKGRSDVNILLVANPETKQILLVSTPRDSYITMSNKDGMTGSDKLTHASVSGLKYSEEALEKLYNIKINYYFRVNFTGAVGLVDALGGITVDSSVAFTNGDEAAPENYSFVKGENELNGDQTLAFVRERKAFPNGDFQRGQNQSAAIKGIINKVTSPAILLRYSQVLEAFSEMVMTDMPTAMMTSLVQQQLKNSSDWEITSIETTGTPGYADCELYGVQHASIVSLDSASIADTKRQINRVLNDEIPTEITPEQATTATGSASKTTAAASASKTTAASTKTTTGKASGTTATKPAA